MIYVLKLMWDYQMPLLELIVRNIARYPQSTNSTPIRYQPAIHYLLRDVGIGAGGDVGEIRSSTIVASILLMDDIVL